MKKTVRLTESDISNIIHRVITESIYDHQTEDVPVYEVFNGNFDRDWRSVMTARLYNDRDEDVGSLHDLHFKYVPSANKLEGENAWL